MRPAESSSETDKSFPEWKKWLCLPKILTLKERWLVRVLLFIIVGSVLGLSFNIYLSNTQVKPEIGGDYTEGMLGKPRYINPVLAATNDVDRDITKAVYSSLFKYNHKGKLIPDLAKNHEIKEEGLVYEVELKQNILWHDGEKLKADDVVYTIKTIQNPEYNSPLKTNWQGVSVEETGEFSVKFKLTNAYAPFLHNLTVGILPKHLWSGISPENFPLAQYNLKPVGSGPYKFEGFEKDETGKIKNINLSRNENFHLDSPYSVKNEQGEEQTLKGPFIEKLNFRFYNNQAELIKAYQEDKIDGLSYISAKNLDNIKGYGNLKIHEINIPEYYALFFNQTEDKALANQKIRQALKLATDKQKLLSEAVNNKGKVINSPLLPDWPGHNQEASEHEFDPEKAKQILDQEGWQDENNDGIREKDFSEEDDEATSTPEKLNIEVLTTNWPALEEAAESLKQQWREIGVELSLNVVNASEIQADYIQDRKYEALLFGQVLSPEPDPFAFWHSSQIKHPGLNLALYENKETDKLLEEGRQTLDREERLNKYKEFQKLLLEDTPAIFLYSPAYLYPVNQEVKGISSIEKLPEPSTRFSRIENWYIKTKRVPK